jgi:cyclic pyranopterin phosphate synthase
LCHPLPLDDCQIEIVPAVARGEIEIHCRAETHAKTGVEMEALTAASVASLTVYDMLKAFDRGMVIGPTRLLQKSGGRSGDYRA